MPNLRRYMTAVIACVTLCLGQVPLCAQAGAPSPIAWGVYYHSNGRLAPADRAAITELRGKTGALPAVFMIYQNWSGSYAKFPWKEARMASSLQKRLMVSWEPWMFRRDDRAWTLRAISQGRYDAYLRQYARQARVFEQPLLMRFAHEMNGCWYPWATAKTGPSARFNGNQPEDFARMWRHVVDLFREEGAQNVQWVWSPNVIYQDTFNNRSGQIEDLRRMYPGDEWVDWLGVSLYNDARFNGWRTFTDIFADSYRFIGSLSAKPMMIAEMGATEQGAPAGDSKAAWIRDALLKELPRNYPRIRLVVWFCRDKTSMGEADYRFDSSPQALQAFREATLSPLYSDRLPQVHNRPRYTLLPPAGGN